jgi:hypothetical protein
MRVNEGAGSRGRAEAAPGGFTEALRRARCGEARAPRSAAPADGVRGGERRPAAAKLADLDPLDGPRHGATPAVLGDPVRPLPAADPAPAADLAAVVRALPVAVEAARVRAGEPLALSFGRSLDVDLRSGAGGVELVLRPEPRLARAADAELPRIVAALRARGIAVARAEVRTRRGAKRGAR